MKLHISRSNSKLSSQIPSVNLPAGSTCRPDAPCRSKCYALKGRFRFPSVINTVAENLSLWESCPTTFERHLTASIFASRFFRWHSSGDIPDAAYLDMMFRVAENLPGTRFLCFSKKHELINEKLNRVLRPANLILVLSSWGDFMPENPHDLPMAHVRFKTGNPIPLPADARICPGYCGECAMSGNSCWDLAPGESVCFNEH